MSFLESVIYGFISGLTEFAPVSPQGHQVLMLRLFGVSVREPVRDMFVHIAILIAVLTTCRTMFAGMNMELRHTGQSRRKRQNTRKSSYDLRLVKTALLPLVIGLFFYFWSRRFETNYLLVAIFFVLNGIAILIPEYARHGNKDARFLSSGDSVLFGILGACSIFPGISRIAFMNSYMSLRGAGRNHSINWCLYLTVPVLLVLIFIDLILLFLLPLGKITFVVFVYYLVSAVSAYFGGYFGILLMKYLSVHTGYAGFAYYSWGAAMFTFVLYLIA